jgi:hypothetical protein
MTALGKVMIIAIICNTLATPEVGAAAQAEVCKAANQVVCTIEKYIELLKRYDLDKEREIEHIMKRYPGHDPSLNIAMWADNARKADVIQTQINDRLGSYSRSARQTQRKWGLLEQCMSEYANQDTKQLIVNAARDLDVSITDQGIDFDASEAKKESIMASFPGFDASQNIGM